MARFEARSLRAAWANHDTGNGEILALLDLDFGLGDYPLLSAPDGNYIREELRYLDDEALEADEELGRPRYPSGAEFFAALPRHRFRRVFSARGRGAASANKASDALDSRRT